MTERSSDVKKSTGPCLISFGVLTVSDTCSSKSATDASGPAAIRLIDEFESCQVILRDCVPDDPSLLHSLLMKWIGSGLVQVILTLGGTGLTERDRTPETVLKIIDSSRRLLGVEHALYRTSLQYTPMAALSRLVAGVRDEVLIVTLPGSLNAALECVPILLPVMKHAVHQIKGWDWLVKQQHQHQRRSNTNQGSPISNVANRVRQSPFPMILVDEAQAKVLQLADSVQPGLGIEAVFYKNCLGRALACTLKARDRIPPYDASIMDGYAVRYADGVGQFKVLGCLCAGDVASSELCVTQGTCVRVNTGGPIPKGADSVVPVENTKLVAKRGQENEEEDVVEILIAPDKIGQFIRPAGFDLSITDEFKQGLYIGPAELGLLAGAGLLSPWDSAQLESLRNLNASLPSCVSDNLSQGGYLPCIQQPRIGVLSTGAELIDCTIPGSELSIRDTNRPTLIALLRKHGFHHISDLGIVGDTFDELECGLNRAFNLCDVVVTSGGVSMGERDLMSQVLTERFGAIMHFARVFMKPGKPTTFASVPRSTGHGPRRFVLVLCLPGNPASVFVTAHLFLLPLLRKLQSRDPLWPTIQIPLTHPVSLSDRPDYRRARLVWRPSTNQSAPYASCDHVGSQMSSRLASCLDANLLLILPPATETTNQLEAGSVVDALIIDAQ